MINKIVNQVGDTSGAIFWIIYIVALIFSFLGILISSKLRHDREVERFRQSIFIASRDPSAVWPGIEREEE